MVAHHFVPGHPLGLEEQVSDDFFPILEEFLKQMHTLFVLVTIAQPVDPNMCQLQYKR